MGGYKVQKPFHREPLPLVTFTPPKGPTTFYNGSMSWGPHAPMCEPMGTLDIQTLTPNKAAASITYKCLHKGNVASLL